MDASDLIAAIKSQGLLADPRLEEAFRAVPRQEFLPGVAAEVAYADLPVPIKQIDGITVSGASMPSFVALMLERLALQPGHRVLEIGAGTGYNAALMGHLVGPGGTVHTLEVDAEIAAHARQCVARWPNVHVHERDGWQGLAEAAPYDRIVLTVGSWDVAPAWTEQLAPGGRLLLPVWVRGMEILTLFERREDHLASVALSPCMFQRLRGDGRGPEGFALLDAAASAYVSVEEVAAIDGPALWALLAGARGELSFAFAASSDDLHTLAIWVALRRPEYFGLAVERGDESPLGRSLPYQNGPFRGTFGLLGPGGAALVSHTQAYGVRVFGDGAWLGNELAAEIRAWDAAGRPGLDHYQLRAYQGAARAGVQPGPGEHVLRKPHTTIVIAAHP